MDLEGLEQRYKSWKILVESGELAPEELRSRLASSIAVDSDGQEWRIDYESGRWLRLEGNDWVLVASAHSQAESGDSSTTRSGALRPELMRHRLDAMAWVRENWGWLLVAGMALVLVGVIILVVQIIGQDRSGGPVRTEDVLPGGPTPVPVDLNKPPTATPSATPVPDASLNDNGHPMVLIPAGPFRMGSTQEEIDDYFKLCLTLFSRADCELQGFEAEVPAHEVTLNSFFVDVYEVTNAQYADFLNEMNNRTESGASWIEAEDEDVRIALNDGSWESLPGFEDHPVTEVTWYGAKAYCEWRGGRLPTEAEWEKAARWDPETGGVFRYPWGDQKPDNSLANYFNLVGGTRPVESFESAVSPSGIYQMAGNVFEWVSDWFSATYYEAPESLNPQGPTSGEKKVLKGGSWVDYAFLMHSANRGSLAPGAGFNFIGFRCAKDVGQ